MRDDEQIPPSEPDAAALAEAQIAAIEDAFAHRDRLLARLRRDMDELSAQTHDGPTMTGEDASLEQRLRAIEARLDHQDEALRHVLERLIGFFEGEA